MSRDDGAATASKSPQVVRPAAATRQRSYPCVGTSVPVRCQPCAGGIHQGMPSRNIAIWARDRETAPFWHAPLPWDVEFVGTRPRACGSSSLRYETRKRSPPALRSGNALPAKHTGEGSEGRPRRKRLAKTNQSRHRSGQVDTPQQGCQDGIDGAACGRAGCWF